MADPKILHRGYCVKSPPNPSHRWHRRWFILTLEEIRDLPTFLKNHYKDYKKGIYNNLLPDKIMRLVLSYYKDETSKKSIGKFIVDDSNITDCPTGINDFKHVIKIKLSALYNDRTLHLCFKEEQKDNHSTWLSTLTEQYDVMHRTDSINLTSNVELFQPCDNNPLQEELEKIRSQITEERLEKERQSQVFKTSDDESVEGNDEEENEEYENYDPDDSDIYANIDEYVNVDESDDLYANVIKPSTKF